MLLCFSNLWPPFPGGAERLIFNIARELHGRGIDTQVLTGYENARRFDGPPVTAVPLGCEAEHAHGAEVLRRALALWRPQAILTHHYYATEFEAELVATGLPLVQVVLNGRRLPDAALAVYISRWVRDLLGDAQPQDLVMTPPAYPDVVAASHGDAIGFVKPIPHKGVELVYELAAALPDRPFVVLRGEWQDLEVIRPAPNITFLEPVVDMRDFYARCRLLLMPSRSEDAGTVAQEATMNGLPCVSTNVGGLAETNAGGVLLGVDDGVDAWRGALLALDDPEAYAAVVARQQAALAAADHAGSMALLAERVAALL